MVRHDGVKAVVEQRGLVDSPDLLQDLMKAFPSEPHINRMPQWIDQIANFEIAAE